MASSKQNHTLNNYQQMLTYYKGKVDGLEKERQEWLAKFDQCCSKMNQKQQKLGKLREIKKQYGDTEMNIMHHSVALLDEELNVISVDRLNQNLQFEQAEQFIKMRELNQQFPPPMEKNIACRGHEGEIIENDLNLHNRHENSKYQKPQRKIEQGKQSSKSKVLKEGNNKDEGKGRAKKNLEQILAVQIIETKKLNQKELAIMDEQEKMLEEFINQIKEKRNKRNEKERMSIKDFTKLYQQLEKKHKQLAEKYFGLKRQYKDKFNGFVEENKSLKKTASTLEQKISNVMKVYQKQNKAKQALILRKSSDFQQDYKAKMRAKQRNLQALKQNYEKMQEVCIQKVRKLQATVQKAKYELQDAQQRRKFVVEELRQQLKELEKRLSQQRIEKAKIDIKLKQRMAEQKQREQNQRQQQQIQKRAREKEDNMKTAYKKTSGGQRKKKQRPEKRSIKLGSGKKGKQNGKNSGNVDYSSGDDDSLEVSDLDNIQRHIKDLEKKIARQQYD